VSVEIGSQISQNKYILDLKKEEALQGILGDQQLRFSSQP
jgi:hypothetical protein